MDEVLLINPKKRRRTAKRRRNPSPAQLRARAKFAAAARARAGTSARAANPARRRARRRNPAPLVSYRTRARARRRNPIGGLNMGGIVASLKDAAVMGAGAIAMDVGYAQIARFLPAHLQAGPGQVTAGTAVKMLLTAVAGRAFSRATRGMSMQAAKGALTVQMRDTILGVLPAGMLPGIATGAGAAMAGRLGYGVPAPVVNYSGRVGPNRTQVGAFTRGGTPLLSAYTQPGTPSPLLSARHGNRAAPAGRFHR